MDHIIGDASGGEGGLGGTPAQAGFDDGTKYFSIPGSQMPAIVNIELTSNIAMPGQRTFRVNLENIIEPCKFWQHIRTLQTCIFVAHR